MLHSRPRDLVEVVAVHLLVDPPTLDDLSREALRLGVLGLDEIADLLLDRLDRRLLDPRHTAAGLEEDVGEDAIGDAEDQPLRLVDDVLRVTNTEEIAEERDDSAEHGATRPALELDAHLLRIDEVPTTDAERAALDLEVVELHEQRRVLEDLGRKIADLSLEQLALGQLHQVGIQLDEGREAVVHVTDEHRIEVLAEDDTLHQLGEVVALVARHDDAAAADALLELEVAGQRSPNVVLDKQVLRRRLDTVADLAVIPPRHRDVEGELLAGITGDGLGHGLPPWA